MATYRDIKKEFFDLSNKEQEQILKEIYNFSKDIKEFLNTRLTSDNGESYIQEIEKRKGTLPSVILLDINLPKLDGLKLCRLLKFDDKYKKIFIIILNGCH